MYLNRIVVVDGFVNAGLTVTLDVFKYWICIFIIYIFSRLTVTLDVFKFRFLN